MASTHDTVLQYTQLWNAQDQLQECKIQYEMSVKYMYVLIHGNVFLRRTVVGDTNAISTSQAEVKIRVKWELSKLLVDSITCRSLVIDLIGVWKPTGCLQWTSTRNTSSRVFVRWPYLSRLLKQKVIENRTFTSTPPSVQHNSLFRN